MEISSTKCWSSCSGPTLLIRLWRFTKCNEVPLLLTWLTLIPTWVSNYINYKVWTEMTHPFPNFHGVTWLDKRLGEWSHHQIYINSGKVTPWAKNYVPQIGVYIIIYRCLRTYVAYLCQQIYPRWYMAVFPLTHIQSHLLFAIMNITCSLFQYTFSC